MKQVAIIQARVGSTRLPGKVLLPLGGTTVLGCVLDRLRVCRRLDEVVVATSTLPADDAVQREASRLNAPVYRGSPEDVLDRFHAAAVASGADVVVRITSDCPLIDGALVDHMLEAFAERKAPCDYLSNTMTRTFPRGLDTEIFTSPALERAAKNAREPYQREHVTPYFYQHPEAFHLCNYVDPSGANRSNLRWTLDTPEDYAFIQAVYSSCEYALPRDLTTADALRAIETHPGLLDINQHVRQKTLDE